jgi:peptidoglycan L-alanyl-D-glutamate endopeptidase CwlK
MTLNGVHPTLIDAVNRILTAMRVLGHPMMVTDGLRTAEQQAALYAQGRTLPGEIVTHADGVTQQSNHQAHADGYGHAVDCTFIDAAGVPRWLESDPWPCYGAVAKAIGLHWGGDWASPDRPHVELP